MFSLVPQKFILQALNTFFQIADLDVMTALNFVEYFEANRVCIDQRYDLILKFAILFFVFLEFLL